VDLWGIPEVLTQYIFQFLIRKKFMLFRRISRSAKSAAENSRGLLFNAYQERMGDICNEISRRP